MPHCEPPVSELTTHSEDAVELVERDAQFAHLTTWLGGDHDGSPRVLVVQGAIGTGKTALLQAFTQRAAEEYVHTLSATCTPLESALPFGVLDQFCLRPETPEWFRADLRATIAEASSATDSIAMARVFSGFCRAVTELTSSARVLIAVDDLRYADPQSQRVLTEFARLLTNRRVLFVVADRDPGDAAAAITAQPSAIGLRTTRLSPPGAAKLLRGFLNQETATARADEFIAATGGSPLLLRALARGESELVRTAVACLRDSPPATLAVARALAVQDGNHTPAALAQLSGVEVAEVEAALDVMTAAGLHDGEGFRFAPLRARLLDDMPAEERTALHRRSARFLHHRGAAADAVAHHLLLGNHVDEQWALDVLVEAADRAMLDDRAERAAELLELALGCGLDRRTTAQVSARLARAEWLLNPSVAARHLPGLVEAAEEDFLGAGDLAEVARQLLWLGRTAGARTVLNRLTDDSGRLPDQVYVWLAGTNPELSRTFPAPRVPVRGAMAELVGALQRGELDKVPALAGRLLAEPGHGSDAESAFAALLSLVHVDALRTAETWCEQLTDGPLARHTPMWQAMVQAVLAVISTRRGDYPGAIAHAQGAMTRVSHRAWGVAVGLPLSVLVLAHTRMGDHKQAARHLSHPVPESAFGTAAGLHYLHARGEYHLAGGRVHAALGDFLSCGELMRRWGLDLAGLAPWRTSAAEAWLRQNNQDQARKLVYDQLGRPFSDQSRTRAASLRLLAIGSEPRQRLQLLTEAMEILEVRGDRFELARVLGELGRAHKALGDRRRARMVMHRAWHVAQQCSAQPLCQELLPDAHEIDARAAVAAESDSSACLTKSERRVASLAVMGYTNREIATKLFVTTSTVEQHLTRVFRKLKVRQRTQLPADLHYEIAQSA